MTVFDKLDINGIIIGAVTSTGAGVMWLIRRVITNQKQIEMLQSEIRHRDELRQADRELLLDARADIKRLLERGQ